MKIIYASMLLAIASLTANANEFIPPPNFGFEFAKVNIETSKGFKTDSQVYSVGYTRYYKNNISTKFLIGGGKGNKTAYLNSIDTGEQARIKFVSSIDIRYEIPLTNSFATYAMIGATYINAKTTEDILDIKINEAGLKLGVGASYALGKSSALYAEVRQDMYKNNIEVQSWAAGFKFTF